MFRRYNASRRSQYPNDGKRTYMRPALPLFVFLILGIAVISHDADAARPQPEFTVSGWLVGDPANAGRLADIYDAGIDLLIASDVSSRQEVETMANTLYLSQRPLLKAILTYVESGQGGNPCEMITHNEHVDDCVQDIQTTLDSAPFRGNPFVAGWLVWDEPDRLSRFYNLGRMTDIIDGRPGNTWMPYVDLLSVSGMFKMSSSDLGCSSDDFTATGYACYVDHYLSHFNGNALPPPVLSNNQYPFQTGNIYYNLYLNLKVMRDKTAEYSRPDYRLPFWQVIQLSRNTSIPGAPEPSMAQVRLHAYAALAYGAKGIGYWTLVPHSGWGFGGGIFDSTGARTAKYDPVRQLNQEIKALGETLIHLDGIATYHEALQGQAGIDAELLGGPGQLVTAMTSRTVSGDYANDAMVGYLKERVTGDDYLLVVNKSTTGTRNFTVTLGAAPTGLKRIDKSTGAAVDHPFDDSTRTFSVTNLAPGDGELFQPAFLVTGVADPGVSQVTPRIPSFAVRPNPVQGRATFDLWLPDPGTVRLEVFDVRGRMVRSVVHRRLEAGQHIIAWDTETASSGIYFCRLGAAPVDLTKKVIVFR